MEPIGNGHANDAGHAVIGAAAVDALVDQTVVPAPAALLLFPLGLAALSRIRRAPRDLPSVFG